MEARTALLTTASTCAMESLWLQGQGHPQRISGLASWQRTGPPAPPAGLTASSACSNVTSWTEPEPPVPSGSSLWDAVGFPEESPWNANSSTETLAGSRHPWTLPAQHHQEPPKRKIYPKYLLLTQLQGGLYLHGPQAVLLTHFSGHIPPQQSWEAHPTLPRIATSPLRSPGPLRAPTMVARVSAACRISCCADCSTAPISDSRVQVLGGPWSEQLVARLALVRRSCAVFSAPASCPTCTKRVAQAPVGSTSSWLPIGVVWGSLLPCGAAPCPSPCLTLLMKGKYSPSGCSGGYPRVGAQPPVMLITACSKTSGV